MMNGFISLDPINLYGELMMNKLLSLDPFNMDE